MLTTKKIPKKQKLETTRMLISRERHYATKGLCVCQYQISYFIETLLNSFDAQLSEHYSRLP